MKEKQVSPPKFSDTILLTGSQLAKWLRLAFVLVAARVLGPVTFGVYALMFSLVEFMAVASGSGYADYLSRETAKDENFGWELAMRLILLRTGIAVLVVTAAIGILSLLGYDRPTIVATAWMSLTLAPRSLSEAVQGVLRGMARYVEVLVIDLSLAMTLVVGAGYLLLHGGGLVAAVSSELAAACAAGAAALILGLWFWPRHRVPLETSSVLKKSAIFNAYGFLGNLYDRFDVVLLSKLAGNFATGIYSVAYRALGMTQIFGYGVLYALLPSLSRGSWEKSQQQQIERAMGLLISASFVIILATMVYAGPVVRLLLGPSYAESAVAVKILIWAVSFRFLNYCFNIVLLATGQERVFVATAAVCLAVNLVGNLVFIPKYSWWAAAIITIITDLVSAVKNGWHIRISLGRIPWPYGLFRSLIAFVVLLSITIVGGKMFDPIVVGTICLLMFLAFLQLTGILSEFANIWHVQSVPVAKLSQ